MAKATIDYQVSGATLIAGTIQRTHGGHFSSKEAALEQRNTMKQAGFTRTYVKKVTLR